MGFLRSWLIHTYLAVNMKSVSITKNVLPHRRQTGNLCGIRLYWHIENEIFMCKCTLKHVAVRFWSGCSFLNTNINFTTRFASQRCSKNMGRSFPVIDYTTPKSDQFVHLIGRTDGGVLFSKTIVHSLKAGRIFYLPHTFFFKSSIYFKKYLAEI